VRYGAKSISFRFVSDDRENDCNVTSLNTYPFLCLAKEKDSKRKACRKNRTGDEMSPQLRFSAGWASIFIVLFSVLVIISSNTGK
jgi:hypothetical protein